MGLFSLFSNDTAEQAAQQRNQGLQQGYDVLASNYGAGRDAITSNAGAARDAITSNAGAGRDALTSGYGAAGNLYAGLGQTYNNLYGGGAAAYGDATGANGTGGFDRAQANFRSDPGYGFQMDQGLQALQRTHAAAGNLSSGNADADTLKYATGLADQSYGNYVNRLAPYLGMAGQGALASTQGQAGAATGLAGGLANLYGNQGQALNSIYTGQGQGLNANYTSQGQAANANYTGQGASDAAATMNNYNVGANQLNALTGALGFLSGGSGTGGSGSFGGGSSGGAGGLIKNAQSLFSAFA